MLKNYAIYQVFQFLVEGWIAKKNAIGVAVYCVR